MSFSRGDAIPELFNFLHDFHFVVEEADIEKFLDMRVAGTTFPSRLNDEKLSCILLGDFCLVECPVKSLLANDLPCRLVGLGVTVTGSTVNRHFFFHKKTFGFKTGDVFVSDWLIVFEYVNRFHGSCFHVKWYDVPFRFQWETFCPIWQTA